MHPTVRLMLASEIDIIIDYFLHASPEHLELLGVDRTRLPPRDAWSQRLDRESTLPVSERTIIVVTWLVDERPVGFSTADKIAYGEQANMHLHIVQPGRRGAGLGTACVRQTAALYFDVLALERLFCEPSAFNVAPNRALQNAGFRYVKTHMTVPGPLNFHQAVTRWVIDRTSPALQSHERPPSDG